MNRREMLELSATTLLATGLGARLYAAPVPGARFLLVFLRGGYDSNNALIPYASSFYYEARPTLAIEPPRAGNRGALELDGNWALAPALRTSIGALYRHGQVAFVPFCGTDDLSRSHFETQDNIELGQKTGTRIDYRSGFMARLSDTLTHRSGARAIAFTQALPLSFQGASSPVPNVALRTVDRLAFAPHTQQLLARLYAGRALHSAVASGLAVRRQVAQLLSDQMPASRDAVDAQGWALQAERMALLMRDRYRIGFVDVGGWDTHVDQGGADGALAGRLASLGAGLDAFARGLGSQWRNTVVVVLSEFGRTFRENGDHGTDHGHGTVYWVLGGAVRGGRIAGEQLPVTRATLLQDRDYRVLNDYRCVLGGLFRSLWGLSPAQSAQIFPGFPPLDLRLL